MVFLFIFQHFWVVVLTKLILIFGGLVVLILNLSFFQISGGGASAKFIFSLGGI